MNAPFRAGPLLRRTVADEDESFAQGDTETLAEARNERRPPPRARSEPVGHRRWRWVACAVMTTTPLDFQVVVDCADPHTQADWWAAALGWQVEPSDEAFIRSMVDQGHATEAETTTHRGVLVWRVGQAIRPPDGTRRVLFQLVPEAKTVKNRLHLDVRVGEDDREAARARLVEAGATFLYECSQGPFRWFTMADPEGNEFCLS